MNRILIGVVVAFLWSAVGCSTPDVRPKAAIFDELMRKSGLWFELGQIEPIVQTGVTQAHAKSGKLPDEDLERLRAAITATYGPDDLRKAAMKQLSASLSLEDATVVLQWVSSDLGRRIVKLEEDSVKPEEVIRRQDTAPHILSSLSESRRRQVENLVLLTLSAEAAADLVINTTIGIASGLMLTTPGAPADTIENMKAKLQADRGRFVELLGPRIVADSAAIYQPLSNQELEQYAAFCATPSGRKYAVASLDAVDAALTQAAVRLGRQLGSKTARPRTTVDRAAQWGALSLHNWARVKVALDMAVESAPARWAVRGAPVVWAPPHMR